MKSTIFPQKLQRSQIISFSFLEILLQAVENGVRVFRDDFRENRHFLELFVEFAGESAAFPDDFYEKFRNPSKTV